MRAWGRYGRRPGGGRLRSERNCGRRRGCGFRAPRGPSTASRSPSPSLRDREDLGLKRPRCAQVRLHPQRRGPQPPVLVRLFRIFRDLVRRTVGRGYSAGRSAAWGGPWYRPAGVALSAPGPLSGGRRGGGIGSSGRPRRRKRVGADRARPRVDTAGASGVRGRGTSSSPIPGCRCSRGRAQTRSLGGDQGLIKPAPSPPGRKRHPGKQDWAERALSSKRYDYHRLPDGGRAPPLPTPAGRDAGRDVSPRVGVAACACARSLTE